MIFWTTALRFEKSALWCVDVPLVFLRWVMLHHNRSFRRGVVRRGASEVSGMGDAAPQSLFSPRHKPRGMDRGDVSRRDGASAGM